MAEYQLEPPIRCDECSSRNIQLKDIGKNKWPWVWQCVSCNASVGCHPNTFLPLGRMAKLGTRLLRRDAHIVFDQLWKSGLMSRDAAYRWLAEKLAIELKDCHISLLTIRQLKEAIRLSDEHFMQCRHIAERRKAKRKAKAKRNRDYEKSRIIRRKTA